MDHSRCPVCFCDFEDADTTHRLECGHVYHVDCILSWAQSDSEMHGSCPVCRFTQRQDADGTRLLTETYTITQTRTNFAPVLRVLRQIAGDLDENEKLLFACLERDLERAERAQLRNQQANRELHREHRGIINKAARLRRAQFSFTWKARSARRALVAMFPVVSVVVPRRAREPLHTPRPTLVRRSERLRDAQGAAADGAGAR